MKKILMMAFMMTIAMSETNNTKVFLDKYNIDSRADDFKSQIDYSRTSMQVDINKSKSYSINFDTNKTYSSSDAQAIADSIKTNEFEKRINGAKDYILYDKDGLNWQQHLPSNQQSYNKNQTDFKFANKDDKIYIVISSSMPKRLIQTYFRTVEDMKINKETIFVLRGTIVGHQKIMPTMKWIADILDKGNKDRYNVNVDINPNITREWNISKVPAVIIPGQNRVVYGTYSLSSLLEKYR